MSRSVDFPIWRSERHTARADAGAYPGPARPRVMLEKCSACQSNPETRTLCSAGSRAGCWPPNCQPGPLSAETSATRQSPRAGPCRPRYQTSRHACQSGRLASTSPAGAWTPCAVSSEAVDGSGLVHRPPTGMPDHQQALSPTSTAGRPRMRPSPPTSRSSTTRGEPRRPPRRRWPPRGPPRRLPSGTPRGPGCGTGAGVSGATDLVAPVALSKGPPRGRGRKRHGSRAVRHPKGRTAMESVKADL